MEHFTITGQDLIMRPVEDPHPIRVRVPGSKSITNRSLLIAALAEGRSTISGVLFSDDSRHFLAALADLGFPVEIDEPNRRVVITGFGGKIPLKTAAVDVGSAGTAARFLAALLGLSPGHYHMSSSEQMKKRPMLELLEALEELGAEIEYQEETGHFPFTIGNSGKKSFEVTVDVDKSSQFLSALLISSVLFDQDLKIHVTGSHGMAYVDMTIRMMEQFGVRVQKDSDHTYRISGNAAYQAMDYSVEPDLSAACYFYAMSPLLQVPSLVIGVTENSMQGDLAFLSVLEQMGCRKEDTREGICMFPPADGNLKGGVFDLSSFSDQALTLAAIAPFADVPVRIKGIGHIRLQECDRMQAIQENLKALGILSYADASSIKIYPSMDHPGMVHGGYLHTWDDHRVAMAFSLPGLVCGGMVIENYLCCRKTFEDYFEVLDKVVY